MLARSLVAVFKSTLAGLALSAALALTAAGSEQGIGPFTGPEADAEAARLYKNAVALVTTVTEGDYSYAYMQFHWKRAGANVDRILRAYPSSPTAAQLKAEAPIGPFPPAYFKERVLPRLEEKKVASFDAINCAIFLHGLDSNQTAPGRKQLLEAIITTLCRQIRWTEALGFPVLDEDRVWLWDTVLRQAAIYRNDKLVAELLGNLRPSEIPGPFATAAEGLGFRGDQDEDLRAFTAAYVDTPAVRAAFFRGQARRELQIQRALDLQQPLKGLYDGVDGIQQTDRRTDLAAAFAALAPAARTLATPAYATYLAGLGRWDEALQLGGKPAAISGAYFDYLVLHERYADALALARRLGPDADLGALLVALNRAARPDEAATIQAELARRTNAELAAYTAFRGRLYSTDNQLVVREDTFAQAGLTDPNLVGRLICEWSLTPNRTLRGAAPWDAVVFKFAPGFENLPLPKDKKTIEAAGR